MNYEQIKKSYVEALERTKEAVKRSPIPVSKYTEKQLTDLYYQYIITR